MRYLLLSVICFWGAVGMTQEQVAVLPWHTSEKTAKEEAAETGKPIFLFFSADWCDFCHTMEKDTLAAAKVSQYLNENFVLFKADYDESKDLVARYRISGVPAMVLGEPEMERVEQTAGYMPIDVFMAWAELSAEKISPEALAIEKQAARQFLKDISNSFRLGLTEDQYAAINDFFEKFAKRDPEALQFAKEQLSAEVEHNPGRFARFLKHEKLHVRILTSNAFAKLYGSDFKYDPWDLTEANKAKLAAFLDKNQISSLLEELNEL